MDNELKIDINEVLKTLRLMALESHTPGVGWLENCGEDFVKLFELLDREITRASSPIPLEWLRNRATYSLMEKGAVHREERALKALMVSSILGSHKISVAAAKNIAEEILKSL